MWLYLHSSHNHNTLPLRRVPSQHAQSADHFLARAGRHEEISITGVAPPALGEIGGVLAGLDPAVLVPLACGVVFKNGNAFPTAPKPPSSPSLTSNGFAVAAARKFHPLALPLLTPHTSSLACTTAAHGPTATWMCIGQDKKRHQGCVLRGSGGRVPSPGCEPPFLWIRSVPDIHISVRASRVVSDMLREALATGATWSARSGVPLHSRHWRGLNSAWA